MSKKKRTQLIYEIRSQRNLQRRNIGLEVQKKKSLIFPCSPRAWHDSWYNLSPK